MDELILEEQNEKNVKKNWKKRKVQIFSSSLKGYIREYCELSSIQGIPQMVKSEGLWERIWWITIFVFSMIGSFIMVYQIFDKWLTSPVLVSLATKELSISEIPFPAVTLCPEAKISRKCLNYSKVLLARKRGDSLFADLEENLFFDQMAPLCRKENHEGTLSLLLKDLGLENETTAADHEVGIETDFFFECAAANLSLNYCQWMGKVVKCEDVLTPMLTSQGLCYSFNMYDLRDMYKEINAMNYYGEGIRRIDWNPDHGYMKASVDVEDMYPRRAFLYGSKHAFVAVFHTHKKDIDYACQDFATQGMRVSIHTPASIARPSQVFISVGLDRLSTVAINPELTETSKTIESYDPNLRNCYFGYERFLKFYRFYSQANCNFECWTNYTLVQCGCVNFYMPRDNETKVCNLAERYCLEDARVSYNEDILRNRLKMANHTGGKTTACHCLPLCSDLTYNAEIATTHWDSNNIDEAENDEFRTQISEYHASAVKVFFKKSYFLPTERNELYGLTDMISNIGGALGLITGFSLFSTAEILYFLSVRLIENYKKYGYWAGQKPTEA